MPVQADNTMSAIAALIVNLCAVMLLDIKEMLIAAAVLVVLVGIGFVVVHELLYDRIPYERTSELACDDTYVAHCA